jgi:hypothetical protein
MVFDLILICIIMKTQIFLETPTRHCSWVDLQVILSFVFWIFQLVANILFGDDLFYFPLVELWTYETTESRLKRELESYGPIKQVGILSISQEGSVRGSVTTWFLQKCVSNYIWIITCHYYFRDDKSSGEKIWIYIYIYIYIYFFFSLQTSRTIPLQYI